MGHFLWKENSNWHLEFTTSTEQTKSNFDEDDILVFYLNSEAELESVRKKLIKNKINAEVPRNPYWAANGIMIFDPDNHKVVFALKN